MRLTTRPTAAQVAFDDTELVPLGLPPVDTVQQALDAALPSLGSGITYLIGAMGDVQDRLAALEAP